MSFSQESSLLSDHLVARNDGTMELLLDMRPSCNVADFVEALRSCSHHISSVHVHKLFLKNLSEKEESDIFDCLHNLREIHASFVSLPVRLLANMMLRSSKHLQVLSLDRIVLLSSDDNSQDDAIFFSALQGLEALQDFHFSLSTTAIAPEGQKLFFQVGDEFDTLFQSLSGIQTLKKIYASIGQNFAHNSDIQPQTLESLLHNSSVTDITLVHFPLHKEHCQAIVSSNVSLDSLSLVKANLGDEGVSILADSLAKKGLSFLRTLSLPGNKLTDVGGAKITRALSNKTSLAVLDLHANQFTHKFGLELAHMLTNNQTVTFVDLSSNQLKDSGVKPIVSALHNNTTLKQINLFDTALTNRSCEAFASLLRVNTTLKRLNLYNNEKMDSKGVDALAEALKHDNYDLERLEISKTNKGASALDMYLRLNREYGRREMLSQLETKEVEYVNGIHEAVAKNDLSSIYFFLQAKPSLCC
ncbi:Leucine-rich repeat protein [Seminavis robusta]|uniref:Leucine-rich repeat protein n=1 Tax=Seminavis robusta TaxID=568900 RepID=A0A9N8E2U3_9STRA|nr:Leucine-rich repeat protein [Seminavis robusta]|eukprot:Sro560_g166680.1 Leucine-rich repeat protein (473) ;mRNA; r:23966-25384